MVEHSPILPYCCRVVLSRYHEAAHVETKRSALQRPGLHAAGGYPEIVPMPACKKAVQDGAAKRAGAANDQQGL